MAFADVYVPPAPPVTGFKSGMKPGIITAAVLVRDAKGAPKLMPDSGKTIAKVSVSLDGLTNDKQEPLVIHCQMAVSFGQNNKDKKWSKFAVLIEICTGIPCGDPRQISEADFADLVGKPVQALTVLADPYINIDGFYPPTDEQLARHKAATHNGVRQPVAQAAKANGAGSQSSKTFGNNPGIRQAGHGQPPADGATEGREVHPNEAKWLEYINGQQTDQRRAIAIRNLGLPDKPQPKNGGQWIVNAYGRIVSDAPISELADEVYDDLPPDPEIPF